MEALDVLSVVAGLVVVTIVLLDAFNTLLATSLGHGRWMPSLHVASLLWRGTRAVSVRIHDDHRRERVLGLYGPGSLIVVLLVWTSASILGWGFVWWGMRSQFASPPETFGDALYYSGVVYFSIGFGDFLPGSGLTKLLAVMAALDGLGTLGLVIGYLPTLSAAYKERESQILLLDDLTDARITPVSLIQSRVAVRPDGTPDASELDEMFREWERWCAAVYESHSSLPMLVLWRSKHRGHSWITALGVVTDAAIDTIALVPGADRGPAMRLYRQSVRLVTHLSGRFHIPLVAYERPDTRGWEVAYGHLAEKGMALRPFDESFDVLHDLREDFHPHMEAFIDALVAPRGFWGVTAAEHLAEADLDAYFREINEGRPS